MSSVDGTWLSTSAPNEDTIELYLSHAFTGFAYPIAILFLWIVGRKEEDGVEASIQFPGNEVFDQLPQKQKPYIEGCVLRAGVTK